MLDDLGLRRCGGIGRLLLVLGHAFLEALDALRDVAHQLGNLAAPEQKHEQHEHDQNMRPAQSHYGLQREGLSRASNSGHYGSKGAPVASRAPAYCQGARAPFFASNTRTAPVSMETPISAPRGGASLSRTRARIRASSPCTASSTRATSPRKRASSTQGRPAARQQPHAALAHADDGIGAVGKPIGEE